MLNSTIYVLKKQFKNIEPLRTTFGVQKRKIVLKHPFWLKIDWLRTQMFTLDNLPLLI